jgi:hypothetical protein
MDVVFDVEANDRVIQAMCANVVTPTCAMEAMLYDPGVGSSSEIVTIRNTDPDGFSLLIKGRSTPGGD